MNKALLAGVAVLSLTDRASVDVKDWINETIASVRLPVRLEERHYGNVVCAHFGIELGLVN